MRKFFIGLLFGTLLLPLATVFTALSGLWPVTATADPPRWEKIIARQSFDHSVSRQAHRTPNPIVPSSDNLRAGMKIYRDACAGCHGDASKPSHWGSASFYPRVPQFGFEPPTKPDWQLFWIVKHGIRYSGMAAWDGELPDQKIWAVVTFLADLRSLPPDLRAEWQQH